MNTFWKTTKRKAEAISSGVFLIALGIIFYFGTWWPGILIAIWAALSTRQSLTNRWYDLGVSSVILLGAFLVFLYNISWATLGPTFFILGGVYLILREYFFDLEKKS